MFEIINQVSPETEVFYSHSRLRQMILGGVTRHVLEAAMIPVMMSR